MHRRDHTVGVVAREWIVSVEDWHQSRFVCAEFALQDCDRLRVAHRAKGSVDAGHGAECDARVRAVGSCHREGQRHEITRVVREEIEQVGGSTLPLDLCVLLV